MPLDSDEGEKGMTAKTSQARRNAFISAVRETGNQTLAAERAKVSQSWVQLHRSTDPMFKAAVIEAIEAAKAQLKAAASVEPARGWRTHGGEELTVRGTKGRRIQVARPRLKAWTPRVEERFLLALTERCNVSAACAAVGLSVCSAYGHRDRWADFARRWDRALELGYLQLEAALLFEARRALEPIDDPETLDLLDGCPGPVQPMTVDDAIRLWRLQGKRYGGRKERVGGPPKVATEAELRQTLERQFGRLARVKAAQTAGLLPPREDE